VASSMTADRETMDSDTAAGHAGKHPPASMSKGMRSDLRL